MTKYITFSNFLNQAMHPVEKLVLGAFKQDPGKTYSTTQLVHEVFTTEYTNVNRRIHSKERREERRGYAQKAKLHRKLLYHVNKLVRQGLLTVSGVKGKGEKLFSLSMDEGELVVQSKEERIVIAKPATITTQLDRYTEGGVIRKFRPENWLNKEQAVMLDGEEFKNLTTTQERLQKIFPAVSDVIAIVNFQALVEKASSESLTPFIESLSLDAHDYDVQVSLLVNLAKVESEERLLEVLHHVLDSPEKSYNVIFAVTPRLMTKKDSFIKALTALFGERHKKLTLKNMSIWPAPIFYGRAGPYALTPDEWTYYKQRVKGKADGCVISGISAVIDINRYFEEEKGTPGGFRELLLRASQAFFEVDEKKRRYFASTTGHLAPHGTGKDMKEFFKLSKHYLRFWNYDWTESNQYHILDLLTSGKEEVKEFSQAQEIIFKSCGLPIRFHLDLSTSFAKFDQDFFSERRYQKTVMQSMKDLQTKEMKTYLQTRERLFKIFEGADRLRFFIARGTPLNESVQIARYLLRAYDFPIFTLDYRGKTGELKLTTFLEDG